mmetsp:Transcript_17227/g.35382  ORF Transcript_17227/g.35382 Transcript_17227/m.35382 type:complete len:410 (+) Transcript_17227:784-2013(+)
MERNDQPAAFKYFQKLLLTYYISDVYQVNSYVQESLVDVYRACDEIHALLMKEDHKIEDESKDILPALFDRISKLGPQLKKSVEPSPLNWDFVVVLRYFWTNVPLLPTLTKTSTIEVETFSIMNAMTIVSKGCEDSILQRQIHDLEYLHQAIIEADKGSLVVVLTFLIHIASVIFFLSRFVALASGKYSLFTQVGFWWQLTVVLAAIFALFYFAENLSHFLWLWVKLGVKVKSGKLKVETCDGLRKIKKLTLTRVWLTILEMIAILLSIIALVWSVVLNDFPQIGTSESVPFFIAIGAICATACATTYSFYTEYFVGYHLPSNLGEFVFEGFRGEIEAVHESLSIPENKFEEKQLQERATREYVAQEFLHKYRFDAVLGPDRFGSILQYLQCGMEEAEKTEEIDEHELC